MADERRSEDRLAAARRDRTRPRTKVVTSAAELAAHQGHGDRSGSRYLAVLVEVGFAHVADRDGGRLHVQLYEPLEVERARRLPADAQQELFERDPHEAVTNADKRRRMWCYIRRRMCPPPTMN